MLVLSRKEGQTIIVGDGLIKITIVQLSNSRVRVGIEAPSDISVHRGEIQTKVDAETKATQEQGE